MRARRRPVKFSVGEVTRSLPLASAIARGRLNRSGTVCRRAMIVDRPPQQQTRARRPDREGFVQRDGVRVFYELHGEGEPAVLFLPTWEIVHSRAWKYQVPYFARRRRVVTF